LIAILLPDCAVSNRNRIERKSSVAYVRGGKVYGDWPGLKSDQLYEGRDLALTTDFRDVFGEIAAKHLGATNLRAVFPGYDGSVSKFRGVLG